MENTETSLKFLVTCTTKKCENGEIPIEIESTEAEPIVICGVCTKKISDITPVAEPKLKTDELPNDSA